jgi:hypothetical protein
MRNRILQRLENKRRNRFQMGGIPLPGGEMEPIPGSDAVVFNGQTHDEGGIMMDNVTEVEDGETMDQVTMRGGGPKDYFFSSYLKTGGKSFADNHKEILQDGGSQSDIDYLAKMQEQAAGRDPNQVAKLGGVVKYQGGGEVTVRNSEEGRKFKVASDEVYGGIDDEMGIVPDRQPGYMVDGVQMYTGKDDSAFRKQLDDPNFREAWMSNVDPDVLEAAGITDFSDMADSANVTAYQNAWNDKYKDNQIEVDGKFGEQTFRTARKKSDDVIDGGELPEVTIDGNKDPEITPTIPKKVKKDHTAALLGIGSMIPAVMAFNEKPDYMKDPDLMAPGVVKSERVAKQHLDRVDFNDQIARNAADAGAMNKFIETSGGGPASMSNKMAMYAKKQRGDREIKAQESRANIAIANEEAGMDLKRKERNATAALDASKFNVTAQQDASKSNIRNEMFVDEFNRSADAATKDRRLNAVQYGINTLASLHRDKLMYKASADVTDAIDGQRGAIDRFNNRTNNIIPYNETTTTNNQRNSSILLGDAAGDAAIMEGSVNSSGDKIIKNGEWVPIKAKRGGYRRIKNLRR